MGWVLVAGMKFLMKLKKNKIKGVFSQQHSFLMLCPSLLLEEELLMLMLPPLTATAHNSEFSSHQETNVSWPCLPGHGNIISHHLST